MLGVQRSLDSQRSTKRTRNAGHAGVPPQWRRYRKVRVDFVNDQVTFLLSQTLPSLDPFPSLEMSQVLCGLLTSMLSVRDHTGLQASSL